MTIVIESDQSRDVLECVKICDQTGSFYSTYHFMTDDSLQSTDKNQQESRAVTGKPQYDAVVKSDTDRNLQQHRAVLPAIARLSYLLLLKCNFDNFL